MKYDNAYKKPRMIVAITSAVIALVFIIVGVVLILGVGGGGRTYSVTLSGSDAQTVTFTPSEDGDYYFATVSGESYVTDFEISDSDEEPVTPSLGNYGYCYELEKGETYTIALEGKKGKTVKFSIYTEEQYEKYLENAEDELEDELEDLFD